MLFIDPTRFYLFCVVCLIPFSVAVFNVLFAVVVYVLNTRVALIYHCTVHVYHSKRNYNLLFKPQNIWSPEY